MNPPDKPARRKVIYKVTYPNGKIYVGKEPSPFFGLNDEWKEMPKRNRHWSLLALVLLIAACGSTAAVTTTVEAPTTSATTSLATTTASPTITTARTLIHPWGAAVDGVGVSVIVPDGWDIQDGYVVKGDETDGTLVAVIAGMVEHVYADRCQWTSTELDPPLGPTVADLVTAFSTIWGSGATAPVDAAIDGFTGKSMVMTVPDDVDFAECDEQHFVGWSDPENSGPSRWYQGPGQILRHWILDVNGERLLIEASNFPELSAEGLAELETIIDSIQIET